MRQLRRLQVTASPHITDEGVAHLKGLSELTDLKLHAAALTDRAVQHLADLGNLESVELSPIDLTDVGLAMIAEWQFVESLTIDAPQVTNDGILVLAALTRLRRLNIRDARRVTPRGVDQLKSVLPLECKVTIPPLVQRGQRPSRTHSVATSEAP